MKRITKWFSGILAAVMMLQMFPTALADEIRSIDLSGSETVETYEEPIKEAEIIGEIEEKREEYTKYFYTDMGTYVAAQYPVPVHYLDEEGEYQEIDNSLSDSEESGMVENKNAQYKIKLSKKSNGSKLVSIKGKGSEISWNLLGQLKTDMEIISTETEESDDKTIVKNAVSSAIYRDIFPSADIEYHISGKEIKENIILKDKSAQNEFVYEFKAKGYSVSLEDKTVIFTEEKTGEVFTFSAPVVYDANRNSTEDYTLSISNQKNNKFTLTLSVSRDWLDSEERVYPVTVDPIASTDYDESGHWEIYVHEAVPNSNQYYGYEHTKVGISQGGYRTRTFFKFDNHPVLQTNDRLVRAYLQLHTYSGYENNYGENTKVGVYEMTTDWDNNETWNSIFGNDTNNGYDPTCIDYKTITSAGTYIFDITPVARKWYALSNFKFNKGVMLKLVDETNYHSNRQVHFVSTDYAYPTANTYPWGFFEYRNTNGIEDYYTYQSASLRSGTAYINNYTGQASFVHNIASYSDNFATASLDATYNSSREANTTVLGSGWSLNIFAKIEENIPEGETDPDSVYTYKLTDGDGTEHYFYQDKNGAWVDEDGLGMTLDYAKKTITFKDKTTYEFYANGYLWKTTKPNKHYVTINENQTSISVDGVSVITLNYDSTGEGRKLVSVVDKYNRTQETYGYQDGKLTSITYYDGTKTEFKYVHFVIYTSVMYEPLTSGDNIAEIYHPDVEGHRDYIDIEYSLVEGAYRVKSMFQCSEGTTEKHGISSVVYDQNQTKFTYTDGSYAVCQFDDFGRTSSCYDSFGNVSTGRYNAEDGIKKNKLAQSSGFFNPSFSYITDGSFSKKLESYSVSGSAEIVDIDAPIAYRAAKMSASNSYISTVPLSHTSGGSYTVSAYVKVDSITEVGAGIQVITSSGRTISSDMVTGATDSASDGGFRRVTATVSLSSGETVSSVRAGLFSGSGTVYITGLTMVSGRYASDNNLIANSSFETSGYEKLEDASVFSTDEKHSGSRSIKIGPSVAGEGQTKTYISKDGTTSGNAGDVISFGGWAKANALPKCEATEANPKRYFEIIIYFQKESDGEWISAEGGTAYFNQGVNTWQFASSTVKAPEDYINISVECYYFNQTNVGYFDDVFLIKSHQNTYTYDSNGNLTSSVDAANQASSFNFDSNSNLKSMIDPTGLNYTYEYDDKGNLTKATSSSGQVITITYDPYGKSTPIQTVTSNGSGSMKIITSADYTDGGRKTESNTDQRGKTTSYDYDGKDRVSKVTNPDNSTVTYTYDDYTDRMTSVSSEGASVSYEYNTNGSLYSITQGGYSYTFSYDELGRTTNVKVAETTLVENAYDSRGNVSRVIYGNGNEAYYTYDDRDQVKNVQTIGDTWQTVHYDYDSKGNVIEKTVSNDKETLNYNYLYDILGRITSYYGNGHEVSIKYDEKNRTVAFTNKVGNQAYTTEYSYNSKSGLIENTKSSSGNSVFEKTYTYDELGRIEKYLYNTEESGDDKNGEVCFTYCAGGVSGSTTTLVKTMKVGGNTYEYTYNDVGNITKVTKNGAEIQSYTYDNLNQLTRENNKETNETVVYTYDNHGNILSKTVYPYNNTSATGKTINYGYDSSWTDLLVSYNGQTITYDQIGNPLNYRDGFSFKWSGGRKLTSVKLDNGSVYLTGEYRYNDNGIRTYKEVNGNVTKYYLNGSTILTEETNYGGVTRRIDYVYDENGSVYGFSVGNNKYYYQKNLQGDVIGILDNSGNLLVKYVYDAYGVPTTSFPGITSSMSASQKQNIYILGSNNPFRYRGYYFDTETGFYYLNSRYYDPVVGRFINLDNQLSGVGGDVLGYNMFAYCGNNPVNRADPTGEAWWHWAIGAAVVVGFAVATVVTCGGSLAVAAASVGMVASGVAASTTATTIAAAGLIGSATAYGFAAMSAAANSNSIEEFNEQGSWATVGATLFGGATGVADGYSMSKAQNNPTPPNTNISRGSTGRTEPNNLLEKLAMEKVKADPAAGTPLTKITMTDPRWPASEGWVKMQQIVPTSQGDINIHYVYNPKVQIFDDFKFIS